MNANWLKVFIAAVFEVLWVIGLKHSDSVLSWGGTLVAIFISFYLMIMASKTLPVGTVYAVFVGMGTAGTVLSEVLFFGEPAQVAKFLLILLLLLGVIGLKVLTPSKAQEGGE